MRGSVEFFRRARQDLDDIYLYVATDRPTSAERLIRDLIETIYEVAAHPMLGQARDDQVTDSGIALARVLHGSRDLSTVQWPK
jgi:plasmid stabilization system protein ParE